MTKRTLLFGQPESRTDRLGRCPVIGDRWVHRSWESCEDWSESPASAAVPVKAAVMAQNGVEPIRLPSSSQTTRHREKRGQLQRTG